MGDGTEDVAIVPVALTAEDSREWIRAYNDDRTAKRAGLFGKQAGDGYIRAFSILDYREPHRNNATVAAGSSVYCCREGGTMKQWDSVDEILDYAISQEEQAVQFYTDLAARVNKAWVRKVFEDYANEERGHKRKLLAIKEGKLLQTEDQVLDDLKIADYLVDAIPDASMGYREALILAMKKEKAAFMLYNDLAEASRDPDIRTIFLNLAQEEAKHKLRFELEYDDTIQSAN